jgi:hypothetical protein
MEGTFGLIEMSGIKLIGSFKTSSQLTEGIRVKMTRCGIMSDGIAFYFFEPMIP